MGWRTVAHNVALHLGSWLLEGVAAELTAIDSQPESYSYETYPVEEPEIIEIPAPPTPYDRFHIKKLIHRGAWGFDGFCYYTGLDLHYLQPTMLLAIPGANGDRFFRIARITDKTVIVVRADYEFREEEPIEVLDWPLQQGAYYGSAPAYSRTPALL